MLRDTEIAFRSNYENTKSATWSLPRPDATCCTNFIVI